jgi:hypothetical protein
MRTFLDSTKLQRIALAGDRRLDALHGARDEAVHRGHRPQRELGSRDGVYQYLERHRQERPARASATATAGLQAAAGWAVWQDGKARRQQSYIVRVAAIEHDVHGHDIHRRVDDVGP